MAATAKDLKDFFALSGNNAPVTNAQLDDLAAWFSDHTGTENPTPDDFVDYVYETFRQQVVSHKKSTSVQAWG